MSTSHFQTKKRSRSPSPLRQRSNFNENNCDDRRIYVTDLSVDCRRDEIEKAFDKWPLVEIWHAPASCFAFVVFQYRHDVQKAIDELDGQTIGNARVRVSLARPRPNRRSNRKNHRKRLESIRLRRCYRCGNRGHLSDNCENQFQRF